MTKTKSSEVRTPALAASPKPAGNPEIPGTLPVKDLRPSSTNPRKTFSEEGLRQLADSFAKHGILQPLIVRPMGAKGHFDGRAWQDVEVFEIVCGERRYRAAQLAEVGDVPVVARFLTDAEVLEIQLIENDQREDVLPSEQAAAYGRLVAAGGTIEQITKITGKTSSFIRSVLALAKLPAWALDRVDSGDLPRRTAELVARIPGEESRAVCAAWVLCDEYPPEKCKDVAKWVKANLGSEVATYRDTEDVIRREFQIELKRAKFDRQALDLVEVAGSCEECPKRAGNNAEAKEAGTRADVCLDPHCFQAKTDEHNKRFLKSAKESGRTVLPQSRASELFDSWDRHALKYGSDYVDLGAKTYEHGANGREFKSLLKGLPEEKIIIAVDQDGTPRELVKASEAKKLLGGSKKGAEKLSASDQKWKAQEHAQRKLEEARKAAVVRACGIVAGKTASDFWSQGGTEEAMKALTIALIDAVWNDAARLVVKRRELGSGDARDLLTKHAATLQTSRELFSLMTELLTAKRGLGGFAGGNGDKTDREFWKAFGIDPKKLLKEAQAEQKKPTAKAAKKAGVILTPKEKAAVDGLNARETAKRGWLRSIPGFPPGLATILEEYGCRSDADLCRLAEKQADGLNHEQKVRAALASFPAVAERPDYLEHGTNAFLNYLYPGRAKKAAKSESNGQPVGKCRVCGCTQSNCQKCIARTGIPCTWTSEKRNLCSACLPLIETDAGILFMGRKGLPDQSRLNRLLDAGIRCIGHVLGLDPASPPAGLDRGLAKDLIGRAKGWLKEELGVKRPVLPPVTKPVGDLPLRAIDGFPSILATAFERQKIVTLAQFQERFEGFFSGLLADRDMANAIYQTIVRLVGHDGYNALSGRNALMKQIRPGWMPQPQQEAVRP